MAWPEPELDVGADAGLPRPLLELELLELFELLEPFELELEEPELDEPEPLEPEPVLPLLPEPLEVAELALVDEALPVAPGTTSATAPAASTLATPTVTVVALTRPLARRRAATARDTVSRFGLFMTPSFTLPSVKHLAGVSEPPMSEPFPAASEAR